MKLMSTLPLVGLVLLVTAGCGGAAKDKDRSFQARKEHEKEQEKEKSKEGPAPKQDPNPLEGARNQAGAEAGKDLARKIKYTASIRLITNDFAKDETALKALVVTHKGYVANADIKTSPGSIRQGLWKIRIPVKEFDPFREAVLQLGEVESNTADSEDMTEEFYDLESHIKNRLAEEEALRKLMDRVEKTADKEKLEIILGVRKELNIVRDDIQRKQGRLNLLTNLTDLTTVSVTLRERQKFDPPKGPEVAETPNFGQRIDKTFGGSWTALTDFLEWLALVAIGSVPWLPLVALIVGPIWWLLRRNAAKAPRIPVKVKEPT